MIMLRKERKLPNIYYLFRILLCTFSKKVYTFLYLTFQYFVHMCMYTHFPSEEPSGPLNYCCSHIRGSAKQWANPEVPLILARFRWCQ